MPAFIACKGTGAHTPFAREDLRRHGVTPPRTVCPRCDSDVAVTLDGLVRAHPPHEKEQPVLRSVTTALTDREREAVGWVERGLTEAAVAREMGVSRNRVKQLLGQARAKKYR